VPFYFFLSQLFVYRGAVQGMGVAIVPLISSIIELTMRTGAAMYLATMWGYRGVCYASPYRLGGVQYLFVRRLSLLYQNFGKTIFAASK
jgi:Na+-driven multidrug efflux pump